MSTKIYDPEGDKLNYYFEVLPENYQKVEGGDFQKSLEKVNINIISNENGNLKFKAPLKRGAYKFLCMLMMDKKMLQQQISLFT